MYSNDGIVAQLFKCVFVAIFLQTQVFGANILISSLYGEGSHFMVGAAIGEGLVQRGHNVTMLISRAYERRATDPKYSNLSFEIFEHHRKSVREIQKFWLDFNAYALKGGGDQLMKSLIHLTETMGEDCEGVLLDDALMKRLEDIDAIIMDLTWVCGILIREEVERNLNYTRRLTLVSLLPFSTQGMTLGMYGSSYNPAYQPELSTGYTNKMTLVERVGNLLTSLMFLVMGRYISMPTFNGVAKTVGLKTLDMWKLHENFDLHLLNMDFATEFPFPLAPNFIPIGGGLTAWPVAQLDEDLEAFMQSAGDDGVIVFTLGTYFAGITKMMPGFVEAFAEALGRLPQKVIWQLTDLPEGGLPPNIKTLPWLPQNDLLGHPQTRVFIYQGGNNGFQEATYHGVPIVVVPLHGDQLDVASRIEAQGIGRQIDKFNLDPNLIFEIINDVITSPKYTLVAQRTSSIIKKRPMPARDRAAFWVEHVIEFGGEYLKSPIMELSFAQLYMFDILAIFLIILLTVLIISIFVMRYCLSLSYRLIFGGSKSKQE